MTSSASNTFKLGLCQFVVGDDKQQNMSTASRAIDKAVSLGADIIVLPEIWNSPYSNDSFSAYSETVPETHTKSSDIDPVASPSSFLLSMAAKQHSKYIIGGSIPERSNDLLFNTTAVFDGRGDVVGKYRKMHLFDIDVPGKMTFKESDTLSAGNALCVVEVKGVTERPFKMGVAICYDLRFSELSVLYREMGCSMLVFPAAFNTTTGPLHWSLLQRARAADNQCFVATCSPARNANSNANAQSSGYPVYGHSMLTDPWARTVGALDQNEGVLVKEVNLDLVDEVRRAIPISTQKRNDVYSQIQCKL